MTHKIIDTLERDIRNQVLINSFLKLNWRQKLMVHLHRYNWVLIAALAFCILCWVLIASAFADEQHIPCPEPGVKCRVLFLSEQEERLLTGQNGILDTAAQGRALELGQFAVYFKQKIASAPAGDVRPTTPSPSANNSPAPVDSPSK